MNRSIKNTIVTRVTRLVARWGIKVAAFALFAVLVLNPNLKRSVLQLQHTFRPESLIQPEFPAMEQVNRDIEAFRIAEELSLSEVRVVERFIKKRIRYASDYATWWNVEYWPTAAEVWSRKQEDCDGRAVLAVSILRSRGYHSAKLAVGLEHMWVQVNENEKEPGKPEKLVGLLNPERRVNLAIDGNPKAGHYFSLARALFQPAALRETGVGWVTDIPPVRKAMLMLGFLLVCSYPSRSCKGLAIVVGSGLVAAMLVMYGAAAAFPGILVFLAAAAGAIWLSWRQPTPAAVLVNE